jgi:hypothetical protein
MGPIGTKIIHISPNYSAGGPHFIPRFRPYEVLEKTRHLSVFQPYLTKYTS